MKILYILKCFVIFSQEWLRDFSNCLCLPKQYDYVCLNKVLNACVRVIKDIKPEMRLALPNYREFRVLGYCMQSEG